MKEYRIQVFHDNKSDNTYFDSRDEAIIYGTKHLSRPSKSLDESLKIKTKLPTVG